MLFTGFARLEIDRSIAAFTTRSVSAALNYQPTNISRTPFDLPGAASLIHLRYMSVLRKTDMDKLFNTQKILRNKLPFIGKGIEIVTTMYSVY